MAWLQADPSGNFHVSFRFGGKKFKRSLRTKKSGEAEGRRLRLEQDQQARHPVALGLRPQPLDDLAVAQVHAVEVADRGDGAVVLRT